MRMPISTHGRCPSRWLPLALLLAACAPQANLLAPAPTRVEPPPEDVLVKPGPNAADELDPALFAGLPPQARAELGLPPTDGASAPATTAAPSRQTKAEKATHKPATTPRGKRQAKADKAQVKIASVAVVGVKGAPGKGNAELARALRLVLRKAGWPVRTRPARDTMVITGRVEMGPKTPRGQRVRLKWTVKSPTGKLLGVVDQANIVPSGSLDEGFGASALPAAEGAAEGIFRIVRHLRRG